MAVYTQLSREAIEAMFAVYPGIAPVTAVQGIAQGSINTTYRVTTNDARVFYLRVNEGKSFDDLVYERDLLDALHRAGSLAVEIPTLLRTVAGGAFFPFLVDTQTRWAMLFPQLPGREVATFEVTPEHCRQVGAFLARSHVALRDFKGGRRNPYRIEVVRGWLDDLTHAPVAEHVQRDLSRVRAVLHDVDKHRKLLPRGVVHGDLFVDNTRWERGVLRAVFDWEMAGSDHFMLDLAIVLHAWCWQRVANGGLFVEERCRAVVEGYQNMRPLQASERRGLHLEALLAAIRFTTSRIRDFEVPRDREVGARAHLDYRAFLARLEATAALGHRGFERFVGLKG